MSRPGTCPKAGGEPCQNMCLDGCELTPKAHDPNHPFVRMLNGCGHGVLFTDCCRDCEIVSLQERYRNAIRTVQSVRDRMRQLGQPMPGQTSQPKDQP